MELRERVAGLMPQARTELGELVAIRSVADPRQFPPEECAAAAQWIRDKFSELGFSDVHLAETADGAKPSSDPGHARTPQHLPSCCAHYDVQPPLDESAWRTPPFQLTEAVGTVAAQPTARATSSRTSPLCARSATTYRST